MNRKDFLKKAAVSTFIINNYCGLNLFASNHSKESCYSKEKNLAKIDKPLKDQFFGLVKWLKENKWEEFLLKNLNLKSIPWDSDKQLCSELDEFLRTDKNGFDDFGGNKLIQPGQPSMSLLYHALASPRVKSEKIKSYPSLNQLDILENYIYALKKWDDYLGTDEKDLHLMVLAYEYRPAFKTPNLDPNHNLSNKKCAQLVFSRTGISRIGNKKYNYDHENRSYTNKPLKTADEKHIAVTPARYGLFLVELVTTTGQKNDLIKVMNYQDVETRQDYKKDIKRYFVRPIKKLFNDSLLNIEFAEYHLNEKLYKLSQFNSEEYNLTPEIEATKSPFRRINATTDSGKKLNYHNTDEALVRLQRIENSVIISSTPNELIRKAKQNNRFLYFEVPPQWKEKSTSNLNRRYMAYKVTERKNREINDAIWTDFIYRRNRRTSRFRAPKNAPLFLNIKYEVKEGGQHDGNKIELSGMEDVIKNGKYFAQLFEDSICDGCVSAKLSLLPTKNVEEQKLQRKLKEWGEVFSAFSLVTAPDFFPYMDSNDIRTYYYNNPRKTKMDEHFLEGGTINLSGIRQSGNPEIVNPFTGRSAFRNTIITDKSEDTITAVVSNNETDIKITGEKFRINYYRDFKSTSYLPDTGTGIFFPGWDVTYSTNPEKGIENPFFATYGLGSPFPEDMKLCAAANGMWPVTSPDAGRTFQGSLEPFPLLGKPSTSVPLMDDEIGIHENSPHALEHEQDKSYGWDGEQGPFLRIDSKAKKIFVNFTDIGRADYIENILDPKIGFDMSKLRKLESGELIKRMDCLKDAIKKISKRRRKSRPGNTKYWLISAEAVRDWKKGANAYGISNHLIGNSNNWAKASNGLEGSGYLFVFAITKDSGLSKELEVLNGKRRNQIVKKIAICKVAKKDIHDTTMVKWLRLSAKKIVDDKQINLKWKS